MVVLYIALAVVFAFICVFLGTYWDEILDAVEAGVRGLLLFLLLAFIGVVLSVVFWRIFVALFR